LLSKKAGVGKKKIFGSSGRITGANIGQKLKKPLIRYLKSLRGFIPGVFGNILA
jgi:hypothetical protein